MSLVFGGRKVIIYENIFLQFIVTIESVVGKKISVNKTKNLKKGFLFYC